MEQKLNKENICFYRSGPKITYDKTKTIDALLTEQSFLNPDSIAVQCMEDKLSYRELNEKAERLAYHLQTLGVKEDDIVAIIPDRCVEMIVAILAVIKSGGAYLPIDPTFPESRILYMLNDSGTHIGLYKGFINYSTYKTIKWIDLDDPSIYCTKGNLVKRHSANNLLYAVYTSGSTGNPKGVMIEHRAVHNFIVAMGQIFDFNQVDTIASLTTISFDIFVFEFILPLVFGKKILIIDAVEYYRYVCNNQIDMIQTTPSTMKMLLENEQNIGSLKKIKYIVIGGEIFPRYLYELIRQTTNAEIYNMYGPSETTVWSAAKHLLCADGITLGTPVANTQILILDSSLKKVSIGEEGDLYIAGDGLARGYLNREALTSEKFIDNPFFKGKMYRTGDRAGFTDNRELVFFGRDDDQIKLRGFRIEYGEIESALMKHPLISDCVVSLKSNEKDDMVLCCYYVSDQEISNSILVRFLNDFLPEYMIPGYFKKIKSIPMTTNNKKDRNSLPRPDRNRPRLDSTYQQESDEIESALVNIWKEILNKDNIGVNDNFFDLGGNSILLAQMLEFIKRKFDVSLDIVDLFKYPTILLLAINLRQKSEAYKGIIFEESFYSFHKGQHGLNVLFDDIALSYIKGLKSNEIINIVATVFIATLSYFSVTPHIEIGIIDWDIESCTLLGMQVDRKLSINQLLDQVIDFRRQPHIAIKFNDIKLQCNKEILPILNPLKKNTANSSHPVLSFENVDEKIRFYFTYNKLCLAPQKMALLFDTYMHMFVQVLSNYGSTFD